MFRAEQPLDGTTDQRPARRRGFLLLAVLAFSLPLAFDLARVGIMRWQRMLGPVHTVETPTLDLVQDMASEVSRVFNQSVGVVFRRLPWRSDLAMAGLFGFAIFGMLFLRGWR